MKQCVICVFASLTRKSGPPGPSLDQGRSQSSTQPGDAKNFRWRQIFIIVFKV